MSSSNKINLTYPENLNDWIKLIESVETLSNFKILCGFSGINELQPIAIELMLNGTENMKESANTYLNKIATKCVEDESIGKRLYLYFLNGIKEYNLPTVNGDLEQILKKYSLKELNNMYKTDFDTYIKDSQNNFNEELKKDNAAYNKIQNTLDYIQELIEGRE